jgi:NADPH-dependent 2,4-dienoyl-CoA reductase/sulfur reductase-like enzyme
VALTDLDVDVVVVGASIAGVRTVEALRQQGFTGSLLLAGDEPELPYDRPPLSKQFLAGDWDGDRIRLLSAERAAELAVELRLGVAATGLAPEMRTLTLADGTTLRYRAAVLATGASARPSPWPDSRHVHTLRRLADSARLRDTLAPGARVVVIGAGYIGAEVAATARGRGCAVTVVDVVTNPYARTLGAELGQVLCAVHARHGVTARFGVGVAGIRDQPSCAVVELTDGTMLAADVVLVGIGAAPNTAWLAGSGLDVRDGVACDEFGRALRVADVYAAGDVARWGAHRQEHWTSAVEQARAVARNIVTPHDVVPSGSDGYVWSDQYDWKIQLAGTPGPDLACELVGSTDGDRPQVAALYRDAASRLVGTAAVNWPKAFLACRRAIAVPELAEQEQMLQRALAPAGTPIR